MRPGRKCLKLRILVAQFERTCKLQVFQPCFKVISIGEVTLKRVNLNEKRNNDAWTVHVHGYGW